MNLLNKLEKIIQGWLKGIPGLPTGARKWLGDNIWWIVLIGAILTGLSVIGSLLAISTAASVLGTVAASYYISPAAISWSITTGIISLVFTVLQGILLAVAVTPLKEKQKKGWVLLFAAWLIGVIAVLVNAILTLSVLGFIFNILFGALWIAITGYFLFEIHGQFAHVERSRGVKNGAKTAK